ncbi:hypothetical protein P691DRAFT_256091 [Macrolepiota fuliginosa MF-IS2]|uniref:Uncharacterized protein n=1 Tax=Macrolepiota fuliginosa MF-IS2 TaxID=1400762 RepID=A0A9P6BZP9_9AGAR|nr:hypothetical protein P691DRAFT_256091 [Macrolepiota fuliginosa MF-IS2]
MASLLFLGIFVSYFLVIIALFSFIGKNLVGAAKSNKCWNGKQATSCGVLALCSFCFTWYC